VTMSVDLLAEEWARLRAIRPELDDKELLAVALERGASLIERSHDERVPDNLPQNERAERLRSLLARKAATVASYRFALVTGRDRAARAERAELESYERHVDLDTQVVPPLKLEARSLRAEIHDLERRAAALGIDPDSVEPTIDWPNTFAVEGYEGPRYESNEDRKRAAIEFFRRIGGP
jgi:hypothetical protein